MLPIVCIFKISVDFVVVFHLVDIVRHSFDVFDKFSYDVVVERQRLHPTRQIEVDDFDAEFKQNRLQNLADVALFHCECVLDDDGCVILLCKFVFEFLRALRVFVRNVENDCKRLFALFEFAHHSLFRLYVIFTRNIAETSVRRHRKRNGAMFFNDLLRADFRRL